MNKIFAVVVSLACIAGGVGGYYTSVSAYPGMAMGKAYDAIAKRAGGVNRMLHAPRPSSTSRTVVRPSPDQLYSACPYDLADGPIVVTGEAPRDAYWSLSFFQQNTDVFFIANNGDLSVPGYRYILVGPGGAAPAGAGDTPVVQSPTQTGLILERVFIDAEARLPELDAARRTADCRPLSG